MLAGDYNIIPTDADVYKPERWLDDALFQPEPGGLCAAAQAGLDRRDAPAPPGRAHLHLLGLLPQRLRPQRRHPHRPSAAQQAGGEAAQGGRRRPRPCAAWEKTSDHAPVWIELK